MKRLTRSPRSILLMVASAAMVGCGPEAAAAPGLADSFDSPEALARGVLEAVAADDADALRRVMVTREEYERLFWPELPESDDMPFAAAWQMNETNSRSSRNDVLSVAGGTRFELVSLEFAEEVETYPGFTLHFDASMMVRRTTDGRVGELDLLDVVAKHGERWKALNFHDD